MAIAKVIATALLRNEFGQSAAKMLHQAIAAPNATIDRNPAARKPENLWGYRGDPLARHRKRRREAQGGEQQALNGQQRGQRVGVGELTAKHRAVLPSLCLVR